MYYYGARYYDPRLSIFISVDPLAEEFVGWTPYHYVHNNPINLIDPTGMSAEEPPVNGLEYFRDDTGVYFWNYSKDTYEHYGYLDDGSTFFSGYYRADEFKEPVGNFAIDFNLGSLPKEEWNKDHLITSISDPLYSWLNLKGEIKDISDPDKYPGVKIYSSPHMNGALTAGNVIFTNPGMEDKNTLDHEYGHYLDYKFHFKFNKTEYLKTIAVPSFFSATRSTLFPEKFDHHNSASEKRADILGGAWGENKSLYRPKSN